MKRDNQFRYTRLADILREQIFSGLIKPGEYILSENELAKYYGLSRTSVRKSLEQLLKDGLIQKKMGQGTIVSPDFAPADNARRTLRIVVNSPCNFATYGMPIIIEQFQQKFPHAEVKMLSFPDVDFWSSYRSSAEFGTVPDLVFVTDKHFAEVENSDDFTDLRPVLEARLNEFYPRLLRTFLAEEMLLAAPITFSAVYLAYNPELFRKYGVDEPVPGWTKEDFLRAAQKLTVDTDGDGITDQYGFSLSTMRSRWPVIALQNGVDFRSPAAAPALKAFAFIHDLLYRYRIATMYAGSSHRIHSTAFLKMKAGMVLTTSIEIAGWNYDELNFVPQAASLPFGPSESTLLVANAFMMPRDAENAELAAAFLQTAFDPEVQRMVAERTRFLSVYRSVNEALRDRSVLKSLHIDRDSIDDIHFLHEVFAEPEFVDELETEMELYWSGIESAASLAERMKDLLAAKY